MYAHKVILASRSGFFRSLFDMDEKKGERCASRPSIVQAASAHTQVNSTRSTQLPRLQRPQRLATTKATANSPQPLRPRQAEQR